VTVADWTLGGVREAIDAALADPGSQVVVGLGVLASQELCARGDLPKPCLAAYVIDPRLQGAPLRDGASGVRNLSYITSVHRLPRDVRTFRSIVPFERLAFLTTVTLAEAIPGLQERTRRMGAEFGLSVTTHPIGDSAMDAIAAIPEDAEAVYVAPLLQLPDEQFDALVNGLIERKLKLVLLADGDVDLLEEFVNRFGIRSFCQQASRYPAQHAGQYRHRNRDLARTVE
jgi:hypothetical protein